MYTKFWLENLKERDNSSSTWEDNIRMDLRDIGWEGVDWIYLAQGKDHWRAVVNTVMNLRVP
jgi:hypothetical protein